MQLFSLRLQKHSVHTQSTSSEISKHLSVTGHFVHQEVSQSLLTGRDAPAQAQSLIRLLPQQHITWHFAFSSNLCLWELVGEVRGKKLTLCIKLLG